ncbi:alpha/beta-hydrolase [Massarina eburnea CBS 473.64]|uniref:Carboxylic ester hydrolase n=1 Tax=Massarina eburnea CBS 473.64 TaxID=1395130 RepID=A0A6A6RGV1_9PLEO|nr:alpha/beta-hydrolase [Massarina eburnea CBS 473.64]
MAFLRALSLSLFATAAVAVPYGTHRKFASNNTTGPTVTVKNGTLEGVHSEQYNQDYFLGIPFAQPPVGALRFRTPQSINASWNGTRSAKEYSAACVGYGSDDWPYPELSEDCLYLSVVRPSGYENETLPVAVWIHGGGLEEGSGIDQRYNTSFMIQRSVDIGKPVMIVNINYRVSMWGFITGEEVLEEGVANLGFRDQRLALHYVQENIAAFGGDADKVTIFGESAGALSTGMHLVAYGGRDDSLFRGAIMQSGNPINYGTWNYNSSHLLQAASAVGCGNATSKLDCLRNVDFSTLNSFVNTTVGLSLDWKPLIDGDYIQGPTSVQLANGDFVHVPIIDGTNSDEGTAFGPKPMNTEEDWLTTLETTAQPVNLTAEQAQQVVDAYPADLSTYGVLVPANQPLNWTPPASSGDTSRRSDAYYGDVTFIASRRKTCQTWAANSIDAFCYRFNTVPAGLPDSVGATHFQEVAFVFNNQQGLGYPPVSEDPFEGKPESYFQLAETMSAAWVSFISELNPGEFWPKYEGEVGQDWVFDANVTGLGYAEDDDWRKEGIDLINSWDEEVYGR